ncbi:MAG: hypothetical protein JSW09_06660 [Pseudomonadota bacterium]|nr:MAG: hypothetical protein JSW09_06660 [Pseudomonadota bacterium]
MLSYLYKLVQGFKREHGCAPNAVYLNESHYQQLVESLPGFVDKDQITQFLAMEVIVSCQMMHPDVALLAAASRSSLSA